MRGGSQFSLPALVEVSIESSARSLLRRRPSRLGFTRMSEYLLLMHNDVDADDENAWQSYIAALRRSGAFEGGSEIDTGICVRLAISA